MRLILSLVLNAGALLATAYLVPGFYVANIQTAILTAIVLGIINTFIKPFLVFISAPLTILTLGLFAFVINAIVLWMAAVVVPGFELAGWWSAILGAIVLAVISTALSMLLKDISKKK